MAQTTKNLCLAVLGKTQQVLGALSRMTNGEAPPRASDESDEDYQKRVRELVLPNGISLTGPTGALPAAQALLRIQVPAALLELHWVEPQRSLLVSPLGAVRDPASGDVTAVGRVSAIVEKKTLSVVTAKIVVTTPHPEMDVQVILENQSPADPERPERFIGTAHLTAAQDSVDVPVGATSLTSGARYAAVALVPGFIPEVVELIP